jgi:hypothetical protein
MSTLFKPAPAQPDITYQPDRQKYNTRTKRRLENERLSKELPCGFPKKIESPLAWKGSDLIARYEWVTLLTEEDIEEIKQAVLYFQGNAPSQIRLPVSVNTL